MQNNRACWVKANEALVARGRNGITGDVRAIFRDKSIEREVADHANAIRNATD